jgi:hypothetical protein
MTNKMYLKSSSYFIKLVVFLILLFITEIGCAQNTASESDADRKGNSPEYNAQNPVIWADVPDPSIIRVGDSYYMSSTTMHFTPALNGRTIACLYTSLEIDTL